jgi:hypothetical protein
MTVRRGQFGGVTSCLKRFEGDVEWKAGYLVGKRTYIQIELYHSLSSDVVPFKSQTPYSQTRGNRHEH